MIQELRDILNSKTMVPESERPEGMKSAGWCWLTKGGFMAIWSDMKAAVNWDGKTVFGRIRYNNSFRMWTVWFTNPVASRSDIYHTYDLDGEEV